MAKFMVRNFLLAASVLLALCGCGRKHAAPVRSSVAADSLYTPRAVMKVYGSEPERALAIVDSALLIGNISPFRADFLRALIYANSVEGPQWDKAIDLCRDLLKHDSTQVVDKPTFANRNNVLGVMLDACRKKNDDERWLRYAIERAELSRAHGMETEALRMEAEIGAAMTQVGRREEGLIKLEQTIHALEQGAPSVDRMDALVVSLKRRILVYERTGRYSDMIPDAMAILEKLEDYRRRPSAYARDSFRLPDENRMGGYCDFYSAQAHAFLARAYGKMTPPDIARTETYVRKFEASDYGRSYSGRQMIAPAWKCLGEWDKVAAIDAEVESRMGADTLDPVYASILKDRTDEAKARGRYVQALSYMDRYTRLQGQLNEKKHEAEAQEYAARYHAMEQEQQIRETQARSARKDGIIALIAVVLFIITAFAVHSARQQRAISQKNRALTRMISELSEFRSSPQADGPKPDRELFDRIDGTVREEKLYTNINLQRQDILDRFGINRHTLNDLFAAYAGGQSFTAYINGLRMQDAIRLIQEEQHTSISSIAEAVGLTPANFREQFKRQFGMTPTEYRQNVGK